VSEIPEHQTPKIPIRMEIWHSSQNRAEIHLFISGDPVDYVIGYNPSRISHRLIWALLYQLGYRLETEALTK